MPQLVTICQNTNLQLRKTIKLDSNKTPWKALIDSGRNKFKAKVSRIFLSDGFEVFPENINEVLKILRQNEKMFIVLSSGSDFTGKKREESNHFDAKITILAKSAYVESDALKQLKFAANLPGVKYVIGQPDLHPGKDIPIGAVCITDGIVYPNLVGTDIGCGMSLTDTNIQKSNINRWVKDLDIEGEYFKEEDLNDNFIKHPLYNPDYNSSLGTIGGGNHFCELHSVSKIHNEDQFDSLGLKKENLYLITHSGSRDLGVDIIAKHLEQFGHKGMDPIHCQEYIQNHNFAIEWAKVNRELIVQRFLECIGGDIEKSRKILDITHNCLLKHEYDGEELWFHRKGAAPADEGPVIIPGSRGHPSFLVMPKSKAMLKCGYSLAHGAGRRLTRSRAEAKQSNINPQELQTTKMGNMVICEDKSILYQEMPDAYKEIYDVIDDLETHGLIDIICEFTPLITYKCKKSKYGQK